MSDVPARCDSCLFWRASDERLLPDAPPRGGPIYGGPPPPPREGDCTANPPQTYPVAREDGTRGLLSVWARTFESERCGVFEPNEPTEEEAPCP